MKTTNHQVRGASVDLQTLQKLRFLVQGFNQSKQKSRALMSGGHRSAQHSRGMEFEEVRIYQAGDDVRTIDWRVTARTQTPHTKCFQEEKEKPVVTVVDQRSSMFFGSQHCFKAVYACHLSAIINWATLARGDRSGGLIMGGQHTDHYRPNRTKSSLNRWLKQLTDTNQQLLMSNNDRSDQRKSEPSLYESLSQLDNASYHGAEIFLISDFYGINDQCKNLLFKLAKHHTLHFYWLIDPIEIKLPLIDQINVSDGKQQQTLTITSAMQKKHTKQFLEKKEYLEKLCRHLKSECIKVSTNTPLLDIYKANNNLSVAGNGTI